MEDLNGKKIATPQLGNTQDIAARHYVTNVLHQADTKSILPITNSEQATMLSRGEVDAVWAPEPWGQLLVATTGARVIAEEKDLWPNKEFSLAVVATTPDFLKAHPEVIEKVLTVHSAWTKRLASEPDKYVGQLGDALATLTGKKLPDGVLPVALKRVKFTDEPLDATLKEMGVWTHDLGFEKENVNIAGLIDTATLKRAQTKLSAAAPK
jgi:NitT/TauT family transport system substrate-binding protein